jgi:SAM-dependent methyltransferase
MPRVADPDRAIALEEAGAREAFEDAALYDWEYRRRRTDVRFYRRVAAERLGDAPGAVLDLACGTGRLLVPLLRDGHRVVGLDRSPAMLARAAARLRRCAAVTRARGALVRGDLRALPFGAEHFTLALCAFHSVQHLISDSEILTFLRSVRRALRPGGWIAFDLLPSPPALLAADPTRRRARTLFRHPTTRERLVYTTSSAYAAARHALHMRFHYQPIDARGRPVGDERTVRLCHRQIAPEGVERLLREAGLRLLARFGSFLADPLELDSDEHIYVARRDPMR